MQTYTELLDSDKKAITELDETADTLIATSWYLIASGNSQLGNKLLKLAYVILDATEVLECNKSEYIKQQMYDTEQATLNMLAILAVASKK